MGVYIDEAFWWESLGKTDWYALIADDFARLEELAKQREHDPDVKQIKREAYAIVEKAVREKHIPLATSGEDFDAARMPIDTIVIHHTKNPAGMTLERLNAMQLLRIYGKHFNDLASGTEKHLRREAVWSGHFYEGQQVFWGYHWLIRKDGSREHILKDENVGWHAGNWDVNTRSIGICIDDDLSDKEPDEAVLETLSDIVEAHYPGVHRTHLLGHNDVNKHTACPGRFFHSKWRQKLLAMAF